ncbi:carbohydrate ABC transporter permease [Streptococcus sp. ZJ93]|uniref:carbohydrate ABC transporter permease n=1 Tax=Streptococcus handemini TaxID=3161188 RepID=UPI0032EFD7FC
MKKMAKKMEPFLYLFPSMLLLASFTYFPFVQNIIDSLFIVNASGVRKSFVGFENYLLLFKNEQFIQAVFNTIKYALITIPCSLGIGLLLAIIARKKTKTSIIYEALFSLPMAVSLSVMAMIFQLMLNPNLGIVNKILGLDINWLKERLTALPSLIAMEIWLNIGFNFLFMLTAIRSIPEEILESSIIDGVNKVQLVYKIIIPCISPTLLFLLVSSIAKTMITSGLTLILTHGGPNGTTETIVSFIYRTAIVNQNYNVGYAASVVGFFITFLFVMISFVYEKKGVNY